MSLKGRFPLIGGALFHIQGPICVALLIPIIIVL